MSDPLAPQPMTPEQVADLVARARANSSNALTEASRAGTAALTQRRSWTLAEAPADALDHLPDAYMEARVVANTRAVHQDAPPRNTCRYCGLFWRPFAGTRMDGHTQCTVTREFKLLVVRLLTSPYITQKAIAAKLDVSVSVIRAWWLRAGGGR